MIATSQPQDVIKIIERYKAQHDAAEQGYLDLVLLSGSSVTYQDVMLMPVDTITRMVNLINKRAEDAKAQSRKR